MSEFTVDYFISKFEAIPEERWCTDLYEGSNGTHCALGHCGVVEADGGTEEAQALINLIPGNIVLINDGLDIKFPQPTPKQRILAALRSIKEKAL